MADEFLRPFAVGGAQRPDSFTGMNPEFSSALARMFQEAPEDIRGQLQIGSGFRSPERQTQLWEGALKKYGSPEAARKWVAPPGKSQHNHGNAADLKYLNDSARAWAHENAQRYGLAFPLSNENWHIELATARGGQPRAAPAGAQGNGQMASGSPMMRLTGPGAMPGAPSPAAAFGDVVAPQQPLGFGDVLARFSQQKQAKDQDREAEEQRRALLLGSIGQMYT